MSAPAPHPAEDFHLVFGLDTEYVRDGVGNRVLCYSVAILNPRTGRRGSFVKHIDHTDHRHRLSLRGLLGAALTAAEDGGYVDTPDGRLASRGKSGKRRGVKQGGGRITIAVVGHFTRADLPGFIDFKKLKTKFGSPRGTFAYLKQIAKFDVLVASRRRLNVDVKLYDTKLLAPAGCTSLERLGDALGIPKLGVPDVVNECGDVVRGITRMDLVRERHPDEFDAYARRDAEIAVQWFMRVGEVCASLGLAKIPVTLGSIGVSMVKDGDHGVLASVLGRETSRNGSLAKESRPELAALQAMIADAFYGGRNECFAVGVFGPEDTSGATLVDVDICGAYSTALAFFRPVDWAGVENTKDIARLAVLDDALTFAVIDFVFPAHVRFPSLPVQGGCYGLIFPRRGTTTVIGPELVVALNQGAKITVRAGVRFNWLDENGPRPFVQKAQLGNRLRAEARAAAGGAKGSPSELLVKEVLNSCYGKVAQAVAGKKSHPVIRKLFDSHTGTREPLEDSGITSAPVAAYTSGIPRAVMGEILANAPADAVVMSITTDGVLSTMDLPTAKAAASGPVCRLFRSLRAMVDPAGSDVMLEVKHVAHRVLSVKTRGNFTVEPAEIAPGKMSELLCARAGHRLEKRAENKAAEVAEWLQLYRVREFDTKLGGCVFASLQQQWEGDADLVDIRTDVRANFDYDLKRRPVRLRDDADGLIKFETVPWESLDEFLEWRRDFDKWRVAARS